MKRSFLQEETEIRVNSRRISRGIYGACYRPYVPSDTEVQLDFNYWANEGCIIPADITNLIQKCIESNNSNSNTDDKKKEDHSFLHAKVFDNMKSLCIYAIHNVDSDLLCDSLPNMKFLSSCTSAPVRYTNHRASCPTFNDDSGIQKQWKYHEVESMISSIMWPHQQAILSSKIYTYNTLEMFSEFDLVFHANHTLWNDTILFHVNLDLVRQYNTLLGKKSKINDKDNQYDKWIYDANKTSTSLLGTFQRKTNSDSGLFCLRKNEEDGRIMLALVWLKWDVEIVEISNSSYPLEFSTILSTALSDNIAVGASTCRQQLTLTLEKAYGKLDAMSVHDIVAGDSREPEVLSKQESLAKLRELYEATKDKLHEYCLSPALMDRMGYNNNDSSSGKVFVYGSNGACISEGIEYISTSSFTISSTSSSIQNRRPDYVTNQTISSREEGEEEEEEEGEMGEETVEDSEVVVMGSEELATSSSALDVCAMDCEMCTTAAGLELTRISIVSPTLGIVYDSFVKPALPILEYNTAFSGVTKEIMDETTTTLSDVHTKLRNILSKDTIIIGHSLDNDLRVLRLQHSRVIDTAALYPHSKGLPLKQGLKKLTEEVLFRSMRVDEAAGHDSCEDAYMALELALLKASVGHRNNRELTTPHYYAELPRVSLFDFLGVPASAECHLYSCLPGSSNPQWEKYSLGYKPEGDVCNAVEFSANKDELIKSGRYHRNRYSDCYTTLSESMQVVRGNNGEPSPCRFVWVDMPFTSSGVGADVSWISLESVDDCLREVYASMAPHSMMMVLTQGDLQQLRTLVSKKQQNKWDSARVGWDETDEGLLIRAAAQCLSGAAFLKYKN